MAQRANSASVAKFLAGFADADAVADSLRAGGFRGTPKSNFCCPLAACLSSRESDSAVAAVDSDSWSIHKPEVIEFSVKLRAASGTLPPACVEFVRRFDAGDYPDLVAAEGGAS